MLVNGVDSSNYKARLMDREISSSDFEINNYWDNNLLEPIIINDERKTYKALTMKIDILCKNADELEKMKSSLIKELQVSTIKFDDITTKYKGFISDSPSYSYISKGNEIMTVKMLVYSFDDEIEETLNKVSAKNINVKGNIIVPAILEVTPSINLIDLKINGLSEDLIVLKNLRQGKKIIVNGEDGTVIEEGINKFGDTDMWEFPRLKPGLNTVKVNANSCDITVKYKPRYM
ncbi:MAG: phage tail protein [Clostridium sp.]|nr:phage tail protein [Clostridium sp.]